MPISPLRLPLTISVLLDLHLLLRRITLLYKNGLPPPILSPNVSFAHALGLHRLHDYRHTMERLSNTRHIVPLRPSASSLGSEDKGQMFPASACDVVRQCDSTYSH